MAAERLPRVGRVVQAPEREDDVEGAGAQARPAEVGLDEGDALDREALGGGPNSERQRGALEIGADDEPVGGGEKRLICPVPQPTSSTRASPGMRGVERARELAPSGAGAERDRLMRGG